MVQSYKELIVWQKSMDLASDIYKLTQIYPENEKFGLTSQIRRAACSIPSNIAEGFGRKDHKEFSRFLKISLGSLFEVQTQLELSLRININIDMDIYNNVNQKIDEVGKMLNTMITKRSLTTNH